MTDTDTVRQQLGGAVHQKGLLSRTGLQERLFSRLFTGLVYAQIWEDPVADAAGLGLGPEDDLVCIASGGCNLMSYLTWAPASVSAVDLSPAHVALVRLKLAAARSLPDDKAFYEFFGHANRKGNAALYDRYIAPALDPEARKYWETRQAIGGRRINMFTRGFYHYGALGRFISGMHLVSRMAGVKYDDFLHSKTLEDQRAFYEEKVAPLFDHRIIRTLARRRASLFGLGIPPAQFEKLANDAGGDIVAVLKERTRRLMCDFPVSENYFAWAAFNRGYRADGDGPVPRYLEAAHFKTLQVTAARGSVVNRSLTDFLRDVPDGSKSAYVLLDAQDWMNDEQLTDLWREITRTARPGARVLFRTGGAPDILPGRVPEEILGRWRYDPEISAQIWQDDRSAIYGGAHLYRLSAPE
ncbi:MAG: DUF3419 family protein [Pseudomonadota bacterium]